MWKKIIAEIQEYGSLTQTELADLCGTKQSTISSLVTQDKSQPRFALGEKLMALHKKYSRKARTSKASA